MNVADGCVIQCEVTKDIPAGDELVAMLTASEEAAPITVLSCPSVVACPVAPAAAVPSLSPRSPVSRDVDDGTSSDAVVEESSTTPVITSSTENTSYRPCPASISSHHGVASSSRKKERITNSSNLTVAAISSDVVEQQRRSFCK